MAKATRGNVKPSKAPVILELTQHEASVLIGVLGSIMRPGEAVYQIYSALQKVDGGLESGPVPVYIDNSINIFTHNPQLTQAYNKFSNKEAHTYDDAV
jgi:hypothetical protein